ncbi:MAG: hypothetical protein AB7V06_11430 [Candidatus Obscuribacterales bacterium]
MFEKSKVLAVILAPLEIKSLVRRNTRTLGEKSLFAWSLDCASKSALVDTIAVNSDDPDVIDEARSLSIPVFEGLSPGDREDQGWFARSALRILTEMPDFDLVTVLDTGSPLRQPADIDGCIEICARNDGHPAVTVSESQSSPSDWHYLGSDRAMRPVFEDERKLYRINRAVMASATGRLSLNASFLTENTRAFIMPQDRSLYIRTKTDLSLARGLAP